ncbi:glycine cleavage system H protein [Methylohalomonas lacus]|uniref:Glycine cleavage system H protein n=1 Tax=Methylohalomonas lacus TaxID=398773 RepID=A0AAE3L5P3_9GAMM|nr:glycine cleavage system protein GcvH [Methylohalomonas lacus]MCS3903672.1 glycine cleavage system H protein [Methylohalomonas lacus]
MTQMKFSRDHEWVRIEDNGEAVIGITDFAQGELGDVVFAELPEIGREVGAGEEAAVVESVKAASDIKMPISGTVIAINENLADSPELINQDPLGDGWFLRLKPNRAEELDQLMDEAAYQDFISNQG